MDEKDDVRLEDGESLEISLDSAIDVVDGSASGENANIYPNAEVRMERAQYSISHLKKLVEVRKDLVIDPDFQRGNVWDIKQKRELVESVLMGIPLPMIYLFESKDGRRQVVDGRQRITTMLDFLNGKFQLKDLKILEEFNNCCFSDLSPKMQGVFEDFQLYFYIIQPPTPERIKYDIFDRVNRGGSRLNNQEMRNALYQGSATKLIAEICDSKEFLTATDKGISPTRMRDRYAALRVLAFYLYFSNPPMMPKTSEPIEYKSDIDDFLAKVMIAINENSTSQQRELWKSAICKAFIEISNCLGSFAFRFESPKGVKRPINMPLMETLTFLFLLDWNKGNKEKIRAEVNSIKKQIDQSGEFRSKVDSAISVRDRFNKMINLAKKLDPEFIYS